MIPDMDAAPRRSIDFEDPKAVRKLARIISFAILAGAGAFAAVVATMLAGDPPESGWTRHPIYDTAVYVSFALVIVGTLIGIRMHTIPGTLAERARKMVFAHVVSLALSEGAAMLGFVVVLLSRSWEPALPALLGCAGLVTSAIRGEIRFSGLVEQARESGYGE
jgi:hypothetical protein